MGRPPMFTKEQFLAAHGAAQTARDIARSLGCTLSTVYSKCKLYDIEVPNPEDTPGSIEIAKKYNGLMTVRELARSSGLSPSTIRYHLSRVIDTWSKDHRWPRPLSNGHLKVVWELERDEALFDNPTRLAEITGLHESSVQEYLSYAYKRMTTKVKE